MFVEKNKLLKSFMLSLEGVQVADTSVVVDIQLEHDPSLGESKVDVNAIEGPDATWTSLMEWLLASTGNRTRGAIRVVSLFQIEERSYLVHVHVTKGPMGLE